MTTTDLTTDAAPVGPPEPGEQAGALAERLFMAGLQSFELATVHLGVELGLYAWLREHGAATAADLARGTGIHPRYAREWLEQQAAAEIVEVDDVTAAADARRFTLPEGHAEALLDELSLAHVAPLARFAMAVGEVMPRLLDAYRTGTGLSFGDYGDGVRIGQGAFNRPAFTHLLTQAWLPDGLPDLHARLQATPPARVLDVGCGVGWSSVALAQGYPTIHVDGIDLDAPSIADARANARAAGLEERVRFHVTDAADLPRGTYDVAFVLEALHDVPHPIEVLSAVRAALVPGGSVVVMDERAAESFAAPADEIERFFYSASVLHCLPVGMSEQPSAGTGTVMRPATLQGYAAQAGFVTVEILPIEHDFFRFYRLT
jgi:2-polyprenyl-3-methyl-5-hydroxy-6-metoxy-1,4-benzoquinol methylase